MSYTDPCSNCGATRASCKCGDWDGVQKRRDGNYLIVKFMQAAYQQATTFHAYDTDWNRMMPVIKQIHTAYNIKNNPKFEFMRNKVIDNLRGCDLWSTWNSVVDFIKVMYEPVMSDDELEALEQQEIDSKTPPVGGKRMKHPIANTTTKVMSETKEIIKPTCGRIVHVYAGTDVRDQINNWIRYNQGTYERTPIPAMVISSHDKRNTTIAVTAFNFTGGTMRISLEHESTAEAGQPYWVWPPKA